MKNGTLYFLDGTLTDEDTSLIRRKFLFINRIDTSKAVSSVRPPAYAYTFFSRKAVGVGLYPLTYLNLIFRNAQVLTDYLLKLK